MGWKILGVLLAICGFGVGFVALKSGDAGQMMGAIGIGVGIIGLLMAFMSRVKKR